MFFSFKTDVLFWGTDSDPLLRVWSFQSIIGLTNYIKLNSATSVPLEYKIKHVAMVLKWLDEFESVTSTMQQVSLWVLVPPSDSLITY